MKDVVKKLQFKNPGIAINAPAELEEEFIKEGFTTTFSQEKSTGGTIIFFPDKRSLLAFLKKDLKKIVPDSLLWFAWPKGNSKIKTDLNRDSVRMLGEEYGITTVRAVSINETWSALRFRPIEKVGT